MLAAAVATAPAGAREVRVAESAALVAAIRSAQPGDDIVLADGTYALGGSRGVTCANAGTPAAPITVRAARPFQAHIVSTAVEAFAVEAPHWQFRDLDIKGACPDDSSCEHAFHVSGRATNFRLTHNRIADFNAHLKVGADQQRNVPDGGLVEGNEFFNTHARNTANSVTPLDIDVASRWVVRDNVITDFHKARGNQVAYGVFVKGGAKAPLFERNLVFCTRHHPGPGSTIGLSFGGGGMDPALCAPGWNASVPCDPEVEGGVMRNNVVINCSDVGIYLNRAANTKLLYNTLIATNGIDFRFASSTGEVRGNVLSSVIRRRNGGKFTEADNLEGVNQFEFERLYQSPLQGDLRRKGELDALIGKGAPVAGVGDDFCGRPRKGPRFDLGAIQVSLGDCPALAPR